MQSVVAELFGMFGDTVHSAFLYAVMIYIWCSSGSALSTMAQVLLVDYMQADHVSLSGFLDASKDALAQADWADSVGKAICEATARSSFGWFRLNHETNPHFESHWLFLWKCMVNMMCRDVVHDTTTHALRHISADTFEVQSSAERVADFFDRIRAAYAAAQQELTFLGRADALPHKNSLVTLVYSKARPALTTRVLSLLRNKFDFVEKDLTLKVVRIIYLEAEVVDAKDFSSITSAMPPRDKKPKEEKKEKPGKTPKVPKDESHLPADKVQPRPPPSGAANPSPGTGQESRRHTDPPPKERKFIHG